MNSRPAAPSLIIIVAMIAVLGAGFFLVANTSSINSSNPQGSSSNGPSPTIGTNMLQLRVLDFSTPTVAVVPPTPTTPAGSTPTVGPRPTFSFPTSQYCQDQAVKPAGATCQCPDQTVGICPQYTNLQTCSAAGGEFGVMGLQSTCMSPNVSFGHNPGCSEFCWKKPVIYLYPEHEETVSVQLHVPGTVTVSDPQYPAGGWKNIDAYPDGHFIYDSKTYNELFYETDVHQSVHPANAINVSKDDIRSTLIEITNAYGFTSGEQKELVDFWTPQLQELNTPYVQIAVLSLDEKESIDQVHINPKPNTFIALFLEFSAQTVNPQPFAQLELPQQPYQRNGFTVVEWGGHIISN